MIIAIIVFCDCLGQPFWVGLNSDERQRMKTSRLFTRRSQPSYSSIPLFLRNLPDSPMEFEFECADIVEGIAIDPILPADFDSTPNKSRTPRDLAWWGVPYVQVYQETSEAFLEILAHG